MVHDVIENRANGIIPQRRGEQFADIIENDSIAINIKHLLSRWNQFIENQAIKSSAGKVHMRCQMQKLILEFQELNMRIIW